MVSIKYALTREDYIRYYRYVTWSSPEKSRKRFYYYGKQLLFSAIIIAALYYFDFFRFSTMFSYILVGYVILSAGIALLSASIKTNKAVDEFVSDPVNANIFLETEMNFSEDGFTIKDQHNLIQSNWASVVKKEETKDYYYLFRNSHDAIIIPKRVFKSLMEKQGFEKLLSSRLSLDAEIAALTRN